MPKRSHDNDEPVAESSTQAKRSRTLAEHADDCQDPVCKGCDVGEVEIAFVDALGNQNAEPNARDLLAMALDESQNTDMARRLFDLALEKYEKDEPGNKLGYATCLFELGRALDVEESIREGLDILRSKDVSSDPCTHARAVVALLCLLRKQKNTAYEERRVQLEEEEDEVALEELMNKQALSKEEIHLFKEAIDASGTYIKAVTENSSKAEAYKLLDDLRMYGELFNDSFHSKHVLHVLDTIVQYIKLLPWKDDDTLQRLWAACLLHQQKFVDEKEQRELCAKGEELLVQSNKAYLASHTKESAWGWEMLAMIKTNQSNLAEDEDKILSLYDEAVAAYNKALSLNPDNAKLQEMVQMLAGGEEEEDQDEEEAE